MPFHRGLSPKLIQALTNNQFWNRVCEDITLQPEIRDNKITVYHYKHGSMYRPFDVWEHRCSDGLVKCVGHLFDQPTQNKWVVVARVSL
jgi:hypothetical protein